MLRRRAEARSRRASATSSRGGSDSAIFAAPTLDDFWITCSTVSAPAGCASWIVLRADRQRARRGLDHGVAGVTLPLSSAARDGERLQRRARLEQIGDRAVAHAVARDAVARSFGL